MALRDVFAVRAPLYKLGDEAGNAESRIVFEELEFGLQDEIERLRKVRKATSQLVREREGLEPVKAAEDGDDLVFTISECVAAASGAGDRGGRGGVELVEAGPRVVEVGSRCARLSHIARTSIAAE
ncbi:MAG: hypothetical protein M3P30_09425 [Chloroflexota bacterium]|nr:hypothetical protein [Chloroflexota bacterium]